MIGRALWALLGLFLDTGKFLRMIDAHGICVFVGPNGSGKSLAMVLSTLRALDGMTWDCIDPDHKHHAAFRAHLDDCPDCSGVLWRFFKAKGFQDIAQHLCPDGADALAVGSTGERLVYSTVALLDDDGRPHARFRPLRDYQQLLTIEHADVLFDEVAGVSDASDSGSVPVQVVQWLHTLRKVDVRLRVTTPAYSRCSKPIRQVAQLLVDCRSFMPELRSGGKLWRPRRGFLLVAYDAFQFEDFTAGTARADADRGRSERRMRKGRAAFWRPGHVAERRYNTLGQVLALGHVTEQGMCARCGGSRPRPKCACDPDVRDDAGYVEEVTRSGMRVRRATADAGLPEPYKSHVA